MKTEFFMPMVPPTTTHQMKKVNWERRCFYEPPEVVALRTKLMANLAAHVPDIEYAGAVRLVVKWCFPIAGDHFDGQYRTSKPDTDNLQKMLKDVMTELRFWKDDAQVASEVAEKFWAEVPGIYICIDSIS